MAKKSKSAMKRVKTSRKRRARNLAAKRTVKKAFKAAEKAIAAKASDVKELVRKAVSAIDKAAERGIIHKNKAARKKSRLMRKLALVLSCWLLVVGLLGTGCAPGRGKVIQVKGSDTMVNLGQAWAEAFMKKNPKIRIAVTGGGSGTGIAALLNKTADIAQASREMDDKEYEIARERGIDPKEFQVGNDGVAVVVHPSNPTSKLTLPELSDIFRGKVKGWTVLSRDRNSGTHVFFLEQVVKLGDPKSPNEFGKEVLMMPATQAIVEEVKRSPSAIGYIGLGFLTPDLKPLEIAKDKNSPYVKPNIQTVAKKIYPISRPLYFYTDGEPSGDIKKFIDFVLSDEGQEIVLKMDFVPLR